MVAFWVTMLNGAVGGVWLGMGRGEMFLAAAALAAVSASAFIFQGED